MLKIAVLISGGGTNLQALIDGVEAGDIDGEIALVISNKADAYGLKRAENHGIEAIFLDKDNYGTQEAYDEKIMELLKERNIGLVVLAGYLKILTGSFIREYRNKIINVHPSLIPSFCGKGYYGDRIHRAVLDYGVKYTGATVHFVDEGTDTGPIISQALVEVSPEDDVESLQGKVLEKEHRLLVEAVRQISNNKIDIDKRKVIVKQ